VLGEFGGFIWTQRVVSCDLSVSSVLFLNAFHKGRIYKSSELVATQK